jgi:hypothetical protein
MVLVVNVPARVLHALVSMLMLVPLGKMQPEEDGSRSSLSLRPSQKSHYCATL